ncbi:LacI family transcriptional regulator [Aliiruegeria haliotis]|uniref:LacI family transcriptional regulator n=1 Tax=Aliiruegeria haliotis TaxID=1280846 RepID=A0A2T0RHR6_9RHOB|nr:LacI family DNA-binding transcriptional regulator [Aliiruegeria haliotis]PRY20723.1 LacI family transcriptional regulator [Aliiruegeria haliotis]
MRPTTKDIAREAGVSLATVDRVLNKRPGVQKRTVEKVQKAIEKIGFVRNVSAANLARSKSYRFLFLLPETGDQFLAQLEDVIREIDDAMTADMVSARILRIPADDPQATADILGAVSQKETEGLAIMAPESPQVRDAMIRVAERGIGTVSIVSGHPTEAGDAFVGIDNFAAGATAGRLMGRFLGGQPGKIMVVAETMHARDSLERRNGFDAVITSDYPELLALPTLETRGQQDRTNAIIERSLQNQDNIVGAYILNSEARVPLEAVRRLGNAADLVVIAHERTPFTEIALRDGLVDAVIAQNPRHLVNSAVEILRARSDNRNVVPSAESTRINILLKENL